MKGTQHKSRFLSGVGPPHEDAICLLVPRCSTSGYESHLTHVSPDGTQQSSKTSKFALFCPLPWPKRSSISAAGEVAAKSNCSNWSTLNMSTLCVTRGDSKKMNRYLALLRTSWFILALVSFIRASDDFSMTSEGLKSLVHKVQEFPYIRRPRQTQGGARQGIIHWTFFLNGSQKLH